MFALVSIMRQTFVNWELIVLDDCSTDATLRVVQSINDDRIRLIPGQRPRGLAFRLNQAIDLARGFYFARMDGDDVSLPERFERQVSYLVANPEIDLLGTGGVVFAGDGQVLGVRETPVTHDRICRRPWSGFYLAHPSWMGRMEWFRTYRYDARLKKAQDYDLLLRSYERSLFAALPEALIGYREERLDRKKSVASRLATVTSQWRFACSRRTWLPFSKGVFGQLIKGMVDGVVIGTQLERVVLRHRALPADPETLEKWQYFWNDLQKDVSSRCAV
jgi:glycosyltransferase involved in cell wall biosynthesis